MICWSHLWLMTFDKIKKIQRNRPQIQKVSDKQFYAVQIGRSKSETAGSQTLEPTRPNLRTTGSPFEELLVPKRSNQCFPILEPRVPSSRHPAQGPLPDFTTALWPITASTAPCTAPCTAPLPALPPQSACTAPSAGLCQTSPPQQPTQHLQQDFATACTEPCTVPFPDFATTLDTSLHSALYYTGPCTAPYFTASLAHFATAQHPATSSFLLPPPDLNCKLGIVVVPPGPEQQATDQSGPPPTACPGSEWSPPDPNSKPQIECQNTCQIECPNV